VESAIVSTEKFIRTSGEGHCSNIIDHWRIAGSAVGFMSVGGHYRMARGWLDHPVFANEPFSRHAAWAWLIGEAAWKPRRVGVGTKVIAINRGQLCHSLRSMAKTWRWDEAKVRRFLDRLVREEMIGCVADAGQTVITVCNYDDYQADASVADADTAASTTQQRRSGDAHSEELKEGKKEPNGSSPLYPPNSFDQFWRAYPHRVGKGAALKAFRAAARKTDLETMLAAIVRYIAARPPDRPWANPATWLNQERWLDEYATGPPSQITTEQALAATRAKMQAVDAMLFSQFDTQDTEECPSPMEVRQVPRLVTN